jgi:hypothetical protein
MKRSPIFLIPLEMVLPKYPYEINKSSSLLISPKISNPAEFISYILAVAKLTILAVVAATTSMFGPAFTQSQTNTQGDNNCYGPQSSCRNQQVNQENDFGDNNVNGINFN